MNTGDIILVHTKNDWLANKIQKFQMKENPTSGYYNHSGIVYVANGKTYLAEMGYMGNLTGIQKYTRATFVFTPIEKYLEDDNVELLLLTPKEAIDADKMGEILFSYVGTPYEIKNLIRDQVVRLLSRNKIWVGRKVNAWKKMICHELTMRSYNDLVDLFPEWYKGNVGKIFGEPFFNHACITCEE